MPPLTDGLSAGYVHVRRGTAAYRGVVRSGLTVVWRCQCAPTHLNTVRARRCGEAELERRRQAGREVFELARCGPCGAWWGSALAGGPCPHCGVPVERLKLLVLERSSA